LFLVELRGVVCIFAYGENRGYTSVRTGVPTVHRTVGFEFRLPMISSLKIRKTALMGGFLIYGGADTRLAICESWQRWVALAGAALCL